MTSWSYKTYLLVFVYLSTIDLSKEACFDYFRMDEDLAKYLTDMISLVRTKDSKDVVECTLERECRQGKDYICEVHCECFKRQNCNKTSVSKKCEGETFQNISMYHFMCLTAKAVNAIDTNGKPIPGCDYKNVCTLFSETASATTTVSPPATAARTLPPTTTLPETTTTTALPPTATLLQTTTTTVVPPTATLLQTTTTTVVPPTTTLPEATTTVAKSAVSRSNGQRPSQVKSETDPSTLKTLLMISVILNAVGPLAVYLYMRNRRQDKIPQNATSCVLNNYFAQPVTGWKQASPSGDGVENSYLMQ